MGERREQEETERKSSDQTECYGVLDHHTVVEPPKGKRGISQRLLTEECHYPPFLSRRAGLGGQLTTFDQPQIDG